MHDVILKSFYLLQQHLLNYKIFIFNVDCETPKSSINLRLMKAVSVAL